MTQPEALRLADALEHDAATQKIYHRPLVEASAAELRRLHEVNAELLTALHHVMLCEFNSMSSRQEMVRIARAAIAKAEKKNCG